MDRELVHWGDKTNCRRGLGIGSTIIAGRRAIEAGMKEIPGTQNVVAELLQENQRYRFKSTK